MRTHLERSVRTHEEDIAHALGRELQKVCKEQEKIQNEAGALELVHDVLWHGRTLLR